MAPTPSTDLGAGSLAARGPSDAEWMGRPGSSIILGVSQRYREAAARAALAPSPEAVELAEILEHNAPGVFPLILADPSALPAVMARPLDRADDGTSLTEMFLEAGDLDDGPDLWRILRRARHRAVIRIALRELLRYADVDQTSAELATLAAASVNAAVRSCRRTLEAQHGPAMSETGPVPLVALGMGKLGGRELNFGSDVDLVFFYETDQASVGDGRGLSVHELFSKVVRRVSRALGEVTEDGFVFRIDLRLRPEGSRGPLVNSLASAERYYMSFGRAWERATLLRARPIAGDLEFGERLLTALRPFVFRRSVDPTLAEAMHEMMQRARRDLKVDDERNVKLGRGGIREAEFFVQTLQLIWGGHHPELRVTGTIEALRRLESQGLVTHQEAEDLETSWALLRRVEHRIHMSAGYQTHDLPPDPSALARSLGFSNVQAFEEELNAARDTVARLFDSLLPATPRAIFSPFDTVCRALAEGEEGEDLIARVQRTLNVRDPEAAAAHLRRVARVAASPFGPFGRARRPELGPALLSEAAHAADVDAALHSLADFLLRGGSGWERVLAEEPRLRRRLIGLFGTSPTLARSLVGHPESFGEVVLGPSAPTPSAILEAHEDLAPDLEALVSELRRIKRELVLKIGLAYVGTELDLRETEALLTLVAECQIRLAFARALSEANERWGQPRSGLAVVGMGKLGGAEMGFTSDLDLIFLYGEDGETESNRSYQEVFARVAQRGMRFLSQPDGEGPGYETDTRLRPSGSQGVLVTSLASFERYHRQRAQGWERQALTRARVVFATDERLRARVEDAVERAAYAHGPADPAHLAMLRARMQRELAGERHDRYHPKLGYGALVDVELATQWLQMRYGSDPRVRQRHTLDGIATLQATGHLSPGDAESLSDAYRLFRSVEQALALLQQSVGPLSFGGPRAQTVARAIGLRSRDGVPADAVLRSEWRRRATEVRHIFEALVAPIGAPAPWEGTT